MIDLVAFADAAASQSDTSDSTTVLVAGIAAGAALIAAAIAAWSALYTAREQGKYQRIQSDRDYCFRQLYELYGPLMMLRSESKEIRSKIGPPGQDLANPDDWRLVDHITDIASEPESPEYGMVNAIISINKRITAILYEKSGLSVEFPPPESFQQFLAHAELLEESWRTHRNQQGADRTPFPRSFDKNVDDAIKEVRKRLGIEQNGNDQREGGRG